ncbi:hypothetical protein GLYMA_11G052900v4 [Glycine max]|uniref:Uncharacterized protein n=2 Tax=Glycine subgen. Soja TaxID=1462606 RepID=A0A0R0HCD9_SOYBN|nr:hypothetical protein GYH30_030102 [Glycine max]KRH28428.1 hypothetical protein GLYMA_11G052900v4 [Glycine max]
MVAVFNKELLSWYLIALKLKETLESGIINQLSFPSRNHCKLSSVKMLQNFKRNQTHQHLNGWEKLDEAGQDDVASSWSKLSIYKIPHYLRDGSGDDKSFAPQIVSIGPYHHGKKRLRPMDCHKWRSLNHVLKRTKHDIELYLNSMKEIEERARSCYEGPISLSSNEFVEMLVLDGCFVLELFRGATEGFKQLGYSRNDPVFAMRGSMHSIQRDMIMLENQLPLQTLGTQLGKPEMKGLVSSLVLRFFDPLMPTDEPLTKSDRNKLESSLGGTNTFDPLSDQEGLHCLDVFRRSLLRSGPQPDGKLQIPRLLIHDGTKSLFLNLIAFEQCHLDCSNDITSYVIFMDNLINSPEDVGYLHYRGIIEHWLGSDAEVADLFNRLCQEVVFDINNSYLSLLSEEVNRYYNHRWNTWCASLRHNYFSNPWAIISLVAAVVLLLLTLAHTYYSIYGYYRPAR